MTDSRQRSKIQNALVETFGYDGYKAAYDRCLTSKRFASLEAIASWDSQDQWERLIAAAAKIASNPKTQARI